MLQFLDPQIVNLDQKNSGSRNCRNGAVFDPKTAEILQFLDPEIVKMDKKKSGSRNCRNGGVSGSRNRRKGRQILYD